MVVGRLDIREPLKPGIQIKLATVLATLKKAMIGHSLPFATRDLFNSVLQEFPCQPKNKMRTERERKKKGCERGEVKFNTLTLFFFLFFFFTFIYNTLTEKNMSWQAYVDSNLLGTGHVSQAAIYGLNGGEWAKSAGFQVR